MNPNPAHFIFHCYKTGIMIMISFVLQKLFLKYRFIWKAKFLCIDNRSFNKPKWLFTTLSEPSQLGINMLYFCYTFLINTQLFYHTSIIWSLDHTSLSVVYMKERTFSWSAERFITRSCDETYFVWLEIKNALFICMLPEFLSGNTGKQGTNLVSYSTSFTNHFSKYKFS